MRQCFNEHHMPCRSVTSRNPALVLIERYFCQRPGPVCLWLCFSDGSTPLDRRHAREGPGASLKQDMYKGEILLSLKNTIPHITRTMCPWPVGLCSQQGVRCCPALKCAFSRQPVPGRGKNTHRAPPPGHLWLQGPPRATKSLHLCLLHIFLSTFSKQRRGNDVFTVWAFPK